MPVNIRQGHMSNPVEDTLFYAEDMHNLDDWIANLRLGTDKRLIVCICEGEDMIFPAHAFTNAQMCKFQFQRLSHLLRIQEPLGI